MNKLLVSKCQQMSARGQSGQSGQSTVTGLDMDMKILDRCGATLTEHDIFKYFRFLFPIFVLQATIVHIP